MEKFIVDSVLDKEGKRNRHMRTLYEEQLSTLPRGSLFVREINGIKYCYLRYRDGKKVVTKYAGKYDNYEIIMKQIEERTQIEAMIKILDAEYSKIEKMNSLN